jgi:hypothetical protein
MRSPFRSALSAGAAGGVVIDDAFGAAAQIIVPAGVFNWRTPDRWSRGGLA